MVKLDIDSALTQFKLANAWQIQGNFENAFIHYQETLQLQPDYLPAYQQLGNLMLRQLRLDEALDYYELALAIVFEST
ncbi:MAG: tetratricopeptide repeat protein, partial [Nostoc sp.]